MEQIIEIFADAISAFILKSISLQEENAVPGPELRKNADVVVETSHTLVAITREVASTDYKDFVGTSVDECGHVSVARFC